MVDMNVPYVRPDRATLTLWNEIAVRYGAAAQNKGFVTGYKAPGNVTSHNADSNGITHAVDIGVDIEGDGTGIPVAEAEAVFQQILASGKAKYAIYNRRIASVNTGWECWAYTGSSPHLDHIHVSTAWDYAWGDPCPTPASEYDSTAPWGVSGISPAGGGTITPIEEGFLMALTDKEQAEVLSLLRGISAASFKANIWAGKDAAEIAGRREFIRELLNTPVTRQGVDPSAFVNPDTSLGAVLAWYDAGIVNTVNAVVGQLKVLVDQIGQGLTPEQAKDAIEKAAADALGEYRLGLVKGDG